MFVEFTGTVSSFSTTRRMFLVESSIKNFVFWLLSPARTMRHSPQVNRAWSCWSCFRWHADMLINYGRKHARRDKRPLRN